ncbi:MAG: SH3 domain-containing protein, partial [Caldilineaceae bacterium]|nr:SH3 domain-containing protein [Caldilineaceae bacterium]
MNRRLVTSVLLPAALLLLLLAGMQTVQAAPVRQTDSVVEETPAQATDAPAALPQPLQIRIQQQLPVTITLAQMSAPSAVSTDTVPLTDTAPLTGTDALTATDAMTMSADTMMTASMPEALQLVLELDLSFTVTDALTSTVPATVILRLADGYTMSVPISLTLGAITDTTVVVTPVEVVTAPEENDVIATAALTVTATPTVTAVVTEPTVSATPDVTVTVEATATIDAAPVDTTSTVTANLRAEPNTDGAIVGTLSPGQVVEVAAISEDGEWYLLANGAWVFGTLLDNPPADAPVATAELIQAVQEAAAANPTPEPTAAPIVAPTEAPTEAPTAVPTVAPTATPTVAALVPTATPAPAATAVPAAATGPTVNVDANLRSGPGTNFPVIGGTVTGQTINIIGQNSDGAWYLLDNGGWVASFLVDNPPADVEVVADDATPASLGVETAAPVSGGLVLVPTPTPGGAATAPVDDAPVDDAPTGDLLGQAETLYLADVQSLLARYETTADAISQLTTTGVADATLLQDQTWTADILAAANTLNLTSEQVRALEPPPLFAGAHIDLRSAAGSYTLVGTLLQETVDEIDVAKLRQAAA